MKVLVACEYSGTVRDAFLALGHDAMSCDLHPTDVPGPHYQGDVRNILGNGWDLMIAHPDCTYLCNSGFHNIYRTESKELIGHDRWKALIDGAVFFRELLNANIPKVAVENPVMVGWAAKIVGTKQTQIVHPYEHGHMKRKATGLWLRNLPPLVPTNDVKAETMALPYKETADVHHAPPGALRWKFRSTTYAGIAAAMASQWGGPVEGEVAA